MKNVIGSVLLLAALACGFDVGVDTVLAPSGTVDSGQTMTPRCVVSNTGPDSIASARASFLISDPGGAVYLDSLLLPPLPPGRVETLAFTNWMPQGRDSMTATAWTTCAGDTNPTNDTCSQKFFVRVTDVGVVGILAPHDTLDSGDVVIPQVRVWNWGNRTTRFDMRFRIWGAAGPLEPPEYESWRNVMLTAGGSTVVTALDTWVARPGIWVFEARAMLAGDLHPENNVWRDTFWVPGTVRHEVRIRVVMPDTMSAPDTFAPAAMVTNLTSNTENFWALFLMYDSARARRFYAESLQVLIRGNDSDLVSFPNCKLTDTGACVAIALIPWEPGISPSDTHYFRVVPGAGVEGSPKPQALSHKLQATVARGVLFLPSPYPLPAGEGRVRGSVLVDVGGLNVMTLRPGANDVSRLAPGVYFVHEGPGAGDAGRMRKVFVTR